MDRLVAGEGAALSRSVRVMMPTSLPSSTTGRRRILCSSMILRACGADVLGSTTMAPRVKTSLTFIGHGASFLPAYVNNTNPSEYSLHAPLQRGHFYTGHVRRPLVPTSP